MCGGSKNSYNNQWERIERQLSGEPILALSPRALCCLPRTDRTLVCLATTLIPQSPNKNDTDSNSKHREWNNKTHLLILPLADPTNIKVTPTIMRIANRCVNYGPSTTQRNPIVPARSCPGDINRYF